ncbi:MAG: FAD-dependent oxidoreductase [Chitinophagaceae bacterium]|nr:FAD-dependent oxidoreductase [Chitinophagaceae bacterium]
MFNRDGFTTSIWQSTSEPYQSLHTGTLKKEFDIIIAGGGITGISTGLLLQKAGMRCLLIEARNIGFGTTGGTTAHLNTLLDTPYSTIKKNFGEDNARLVASAAVEAINLIRKNIREYAIACNFVEADAYLFAQNESQDKELQQIADSTNVAGVPMEFVEKIPIPAEFTTAARVHGQAKFNPIRYLYAIAGEFEKAGGIILQHTRVTAVEETAPLNVSTGTDAFTCRYLIYATHIPPGVNLLHLRCMPYRSYAMAVRLSNNNYPEDLCYDMYDPYYYYRSQVIDGENYLIAGGKDHKTGHEENTEKCFEHLESHIRKYFQVAEITNRWSSQYFELVDGLPYIGQLPGSTSGIYVATGFGGNGMIYSNVAALTLSRILTGQDTDYQKLFDPGRIKPIAGFTNFVQHNADVVKQFLGKLLPAEKLEVLSGIAAEEGRLVKYEHHKLAVFKDAQHNIHMVHPVCTHLKCDVQWNVAERSWDCPCHGARYDVDGKVITGPAGRDLEKVNIE